MALEKDTVLAALRSSDGNVGEAARALGCSRRTLQNRMREYHIPEGKAGRRKQLLPYGKKRRRARSLGSLALGGAALLAGGLLVGSRLRRGGENT